MRCFEAGLVMIKPGEEGTRVFAGGPVCDVIELAGLAHVYTK
jgi:ribosomal protein S5